MSIKLPYSIPEGYFENLDIRVMDNIARKAGLRKKFTPAIAIAASVVVLLGIGGLIVGRTPATPAQTAPTEDEIIEYLIDSGAPLAYFEESF